VYTCSDCAARVAEELDRRTRRTRPPGEPLSIAALPPPLADQAVLVLRRLASRQQDAGRALV